MSEAASQHTPCRPPLACEMPLPVRIYDTDLLGVVNNVVYIRWLEDLRTAWCDRYWPLTEQMAAGYAPVIVSITIDYLSPVRFGDHVIGRVWVTPRKARLVFDTEIHANGRPAATARQIVALVHLDGMKPTRIPHWLIERYEEALQAANP
ncbi:MAG TPA: thioesterase family protein [Armatimonadota bacterium]|jgi:acyl-CoA thioester hydrolase|nr:acyl-CoA thioesterase [Armatimonadota bacterium]HOJ21077.1 thioesterase family protein [Armatimonadota bacterium]HOM83672.1 thioesterase family protein [Armatimonadota bacterium]HPO71476.1 thioesterase family protein [Armatimonadota bacterium]HPT96407.1 thioesterase family protein [Armatimonadota bacterium]